MSRTIAAALLTLATAAMAAPPGGVASIPIKDCNVQNVLATLQYEPIARSGQIAEQQLKILQEMRQIGGDIRGPDSKRPLKDVLSKDDIAKFSENRQRMMTTQIASLIESKRHRDLKVLMRMVILADQQQRWQQEPAAGTQDETIYATLWAMNSLNKTHVETEPSITSACSFDEAINRMEAEVFPKLMQLAKTLEDVSPKIQALSSKYKMDKIDRTKLSKADAQLYDQLRRETQPFFHTDSYLTSLENIKVLAKASELMYEANRQDVAYGGGDMKAVGQTIERNSAAGQYDQPTQFAMRAWLNLNDKIPADVIKDWEEIANAGKAH